MIGASQKRLQAEESRKADKHAVRTHRRHVAPRSSFSGQSDCRTPTPAKSQQKPANSNHHPAGITSA